MIIIRTSRRIAGGRVVLLAACVAWALGALPGGATDIPTTCQISSGETNLGTVPRTFTFAAAAPPNAEVEVPFYITLPAATTPLDAEAGGLAVTSYSNLHIVFSITGASHYELVGPFTLPLNNGQPVAATFDALTEELRFDITDLLVPGTLETPTLTIQVWPRAPATPVVLSAREISTNIQLTGGPELLSDCPLDDTPLASTSVSERTVSISDASLTEGDNGTTRMEFIVSLVAPAPKTVRVQYATAAGTATAGADYRARAGRVSIKRGHTEATIKIAVRGDRIAEPTEMFSVVLSNPTGGGIIIGEGTAVGTINDND